MNVRNTEKFMFGVFLTGFRNFFHASSEYSLCFVRRCDCVSTQMHGANLRNKNRKTEGKTLVNEGNGAYGMSFVCVVG